MRVGITLLLCLVLLGNSMGALAAEQPTIYKPEVYLKADPTPSKVKWWVWVVLVVLGAGVGAIALAGGGGGNGNGGNGGGEGTVPVNVPPLQ